MNHDTRFAIALYLPDRVVRLTASHKAISDCLDGSAGLDFVIPEWWEKAYTVRLLPLALPDDCKPHRLSDIS